MEMSHWGWGFGEALLVDHSPSHVSESHRYCRTFLLRDPLELLTEKEMKELESKYLRIEEELETAPQYVEYARAQVMSTSRTAPSYAGA